MVEQYMIEHKNQFDVFDYEEDGSFKPIFMVGKCQPEEASSPVQVPDTVIEEEKEANEDLEKMSVKTKSEKQMDIQVEAVNLKIETPSKAPVMPLTTTKK